ncbi:hypothetical protein [Actinomadura meyerae]|nr:hypothetical protein [Actinomadura meyerae]
MIVGGPDPSGPTVAAMRSFCPRAIPAPTVPEKMIFLSVSNQTRPSGFCRMGMTFG